MATKHIVTPLLVLTAVTARRLIARCTHAHDPFARICLVRIQDPGATQQDRKVCGPCKQAAYAAQRR